VRNLRVAAVQFEHVNGDKSYNLGRVRHFAAAAAAEEVQVLTFPECCVTGYWFLRHLSRSELERLAEPVGGPATQELLTLARRYGMMIGAGLLEISPTRDLYNTYVVATPEREIFAHRKLHAFIHPDVRSGNRFTVFHWRDTCFGVLICYDNNLIENVRICALQGAEVLLAPHQTGGCRSANPHTMGLVDRTAWDNRHTDPAAAEAELRGPKGRGWILRWLPARAHDNGLFVVFSNGVGVDDDEIRTGNSMVLDPYGRILVETWKAGDDMVTADLDASLLEECTGRRWIRTRRPELYQLLSQPTGTEVDVRQVRFDEKGV